MPIPGRRDDDNNMSITGKSCNTIAVGPVHGQLQVQEIGADGEGISDERGISDEGTLADEGTIADEGGVVD